MGILIQALPCFQGRLSEARAGAKLIAQIGGPVSALPSALEAPTDLETISLHLVIDGYEAAPSSLKDVDLVHDFLDWFPDRIGMTRIAPPQVYTYRSQKEEDWGVSGFVLIAESHITVHTFPDRSYLNVDIFSCIEFDAAESLDIVKGWFGLERTESRVLERGLEYLDTTEAYTGMVRERFGLQPSKGSS